VASVERIKQDIAALQQTTQGLAVELHQGYADYLQALGRSLRQQLVLSGYHVCTQGYPTQFLSLSLSQREALQRSLRELANQAQTTLNELLVPPGSTPADRADNLDLTSTDEESDALATDVEETALNPVELSTWQDVLEAAIAHEFRTGSLKANRLLQQTGILPNKLPEFLKATSKLAAENDEDDASSLLDLMMESSGNASSEAEAEASAALSVIVQLVAVHLQLTDVEFADGTTTMLRNRLRSLATRLKTLKQAYLKKERELAIAEAEAAWRSSWIDD
jgi:hypothetical protein